MKVKKSKKNKEDKKPKGKNISLKFMQKTYKVIVPEKDVINVNRILNVNLQDIETDLEKLPSILNYYGMLLAKSMKFFKKRETEYRIWRAKKYKSVRKKFELRNEKYTESKIENEINSSEEFIEKKNKIHDAEESYEMLKSIYWGIKSKTEIIGEVNKQRSVNAKLENS